jgi:hypothetical protein
MKQKRVLAADKYKHKREKRRKHTKVVILVRLKTPLTFKDLTYLYSSYTGNLNNVLNAHIAV